MPISPRVCPLALLVLVACGDIEVKSTRVAAVPLRLQGEWTGSWASTRGSAVGDVTLQVQDFDGQPVLQVRIDNPCLGPRDYQLVMAGTTLALVADGAPLFSAALGPDRTLVGTFECAEDAGVWQAAWVRELPPILDLGGVWQGTLMAASTPATDLVVTFDQTVRGGQVVVDGMLSLPGLLPAALPISGTVRFREGTFDLMLSTMPGVVPAVQLAGLGDPVTMTIQDGLLVAAAIPQLPSGMATWDLVFTQR